MLLLVFMIIPAALAQMEHHLTKNVNDLKALVATKGGDPDGIEIIGNKTYYFSPTDADAKHAMLFCNDVGMALASFETEEENDLIKQYLTDNDITDWFWSSGRMLQDIYHWGSTGQVFTFTDWCPDFPESAASKEMCVGISMGAENIYFGWGEDSCTTTYNFICEL